MADEVQKKSLGKNNVLISEWIRFLYRRHLSGITVPADGVIHNLAERACLSQS